LRKFILPSIIIFFTILESCSSTAITHITATWKDPEAGKYKDFFVAVLSKNKVARSTIEKDISKRLKKEKVQVARSLDFFPHSEKIETPEEKKAAVEKIQGMGHDAILVIVVIKHTEENRYVQGTNSYAPTPVGVGSGYYNPTKGGPPAGGSYGAFGTYYMDASSSYQTQGYYETDKTYFLESRLFDAKTAKLVWSAQSETFNPADIGSASGDFAAVLVDAVKKAGLVGGK